MAKKKTRMSGVIDHTTMGLSLGTELQLSKGVHSNMRKALSKAIKYGISKYNVIFELISGDMKEGNSIFILRFMNKNKVMNAIQYEFKKQGNNYFLNVSGNPTSMVAGANDIPILVSGSEYGKNNCAINTIKHLNRLMYTVLETLLEEHGFKWVGEDKKRIIDGDISIQQYQIAWYSGDLKDMRDEVLRYLRVIYGGQDATLNRVRNVVSTLGLNARVWDNDDGNLTISAMSGEKNKYFVLTLYAKDRHPDYLGVKNTRDRVSNLIRWDCTLSNSFLVINKIKKICDLEIKYKEECEKNGYDIGFIRFVSEKVYNKLKLNHLMTITHDTYRDMIHFAENEPKTKYEKKLCDYWLDYDNPIHLTDVEAAAAIGITRERYSEAKNSLIKRNFDTTIPRSTYEAILYNRENSALTEEERGQYILNKFGEQSNSIIKINEKRKRDKNRSKIIYEALNISDIQGAMKIRKFKPIKVKPSDFWILSVPTEA